MIPLAIVVGGTAALCWLRWGYVLRRCPECGHTYSSLKTCAAHIRRAHNQ